jgi:hypothetical protein
MPLTEAVVTDHRRICDLSHGCAVKIAHFYSFFSTSVSYDAEPYGGKSNSRAGTLNTRLGLFNQSNRRPKVGNSNRFCVIRIIFMDPKCYSSSSSRYVRNNSLLIVKLPLLHRNNSLLHLCRHPSLCHCVPHSPSSFPSPPNAAITSGPILSLFS